MLLLYCGTPINDKFSMSEMENKVPKLVTVQVMCLDFGTPKINNFPFVPNGNYSF